MLFIFGLLLVMIPTAPCLESFCRFNQTDPCHTALGHTLYLQMVLDARDLELELLKESEPVIRVRNNNIKQKHESIRDRSEFIINNGTLIINSVIRSDSGRYTLKLFNSAGVESHSADLQVNVEAPVGSVEVSISCSSSGGRRVFCSSGGEQLLFSWTLNGVPLTQELQDGNQTLHLEEETAGNITCSVKNHISHQQKTISLNQCLESFCRFNQTDLCYTALGHTLYLKMVLDARDLEMMLLKESEPVIRVKNNNIKQKHESITNRSEFIINNGTLIINSVIRSDSGRYTLKLFNSIGVETHSADLQVNVEESVSMVFVVVWVFEVIFLLALLGGFHIYSTNCSSQTAGRKQEEEIAL